MTKQTTQELELIISDAPESFNYIDSRGFYHNNNARSLDDIREIIELRKEVESQREIILKQATVVEEFRKTGNRVINYKENSQQWVDLTHNYANVDYLAIRDLEQQAKGVEDIANQMNDEFAKAYNLSELKASDWVVWNRIYGNMKEQAQALKKQS